MKTITLTKGGRPRNLRTATEAATHMPYIVLAPNFGGDRMDGVVVSAHRTILAARQKCQDVRDRAARGSNRSVALVCKWSGEDYEPMGV